MLHKLADTDGVDLAVIGTGIFGVFRGVRRGLGRGGVCRGIVRGGVRRRGLGRTGRQGQQHTSCQQDRDYILFHDNFSFSSEIKNKTPPSPDSALSFPNISEIQNTLRTRMGNTNEASKADLNKGIIGVFRLCHFDRMLLHGCRLLSSVPCGVPHFMGALYRFKSAKSTTKTAKFRSRFCPIFVNSTNPSPTSSIALLTQT